MSTTAALPRRASDRTGRREAAMRGPLGVLELCGALIGAFALVDSASAQNLVSNGGFDSDLSGWALFVGTDGEFVPASATAVCDGYSGSAEGENFSSIAPYASLAQCVTGVEAGRLYAFGVRALFPSGQTAATGIYVGVIWKQGADCSTDLGTSSSTPIGAAPLDTWRSSETIDVAPANTQSALILLRVAGQFGAALFDEAYLQPKTDVFLDGFEIGEVCEWSEAAP